jgi:outer membrane protein assembly factor BamE
MRLRARTAVAALVVGACLVVATGGCVYRMTVQQGNFLDGRQVAQVQVGMTRSQVRFLLGTPMLPDAFDRDRWDYLYYLKSGRVRKTDERRFSVFFANEKVAKLENVGVAFTATEPPKADPPPAPLAPQTTPPPASAPLPST